MAAAAEQAWKWLFRQRVLQAHVRLSMIVWKIGNARGNIAEPVHAPATEATVARMLARIRRAEWVLADASSDLAAAACLLGGAEALALRGGTFDPREPLPSVDRLLDTAAAQRGASRKLREAMLFAVEAYHGVEKCCVFLAGLDFMLDQPRHLHLPGVDLDGFLNTKRLVAFDLLEYLMDTVDGCVSLIKSARDDVSGAGAN